MRAKVPDQVNGKINGALHRREAPKRVPASPRFRAASLFSGIGGFDLGLERAGFDITFQCELNKFCRAILKHRWPETPCHENIKELTTATPRVGAGKTDSFSKWTLLPDNDTQTTSV